MADIAHAYTDKEIKKLQHELDIVYKQAEVDIRHKMEDFNKKYRIKEKIYAKQVSDGKISQEDFDNWKKGQVFQGQQWEAKRESILNTMHHTNEIATKMINGQTQNIFTVNANYASYDIEHQAGVNFGFGIYNSATVTRLIKDEPQLLPKWKIDEKKDYVWSEKKLNRSITQGIIQGESLDQISKRLSHKLVSDNKNKMKTFARTAMTGAQNAGRLTSMQKAKGLGIDLQKEWMASLDSHTRDSHADIDGEKVDIDRKFSNGVMYPGEAGGPPAEVYNCRCTMVSDIKKYPDKYKRYDNIAGKPIDNMSYKDWAKAKGMEKKLKSIENSRAKRFGQSAQKHVSAEDFKWDKNYGGTPNRNYGKADTSDALQEIQSGKSNSLANYMDKDGNLTPERVALHEQIIDNYLAEKTPEQGTATMVMMGGGPASGKSSVIRSGLYQLPDTNHTITIDPDDIKRYLPGYLDMSKVDSSAASFYHEESSMLAKQLATTCFSGNYNVVYDGTGDGSVGSVMKKINGAKENGYQVNGMYVTVNTDEALRRNRKRYDDAVAKGESPRLVPDAYVVDCHRKVTQISMETSDKFDNIELYDNNGGSGDIKLIGKGGSGEKLVAVNGEEKAFKAFEDKGK